MDEKIIWIGNRESEILYSTLFYKSFTIYGSNKGNNISFNKTSLKSVTDFFIENINEEVKNGPIKLFFYSNNIAERILAKVPHLKDYIINKYDNEFIKFIENKTYAHLWASNIMPIIEFTEMFGNECNYKNISQKFKNYNEFIIQENYSSGGTGTFLLTKENESQILKNLSMQKCYKISPYYKNSFSVNVHTIISNNYTAVLSPSIQLIENINDRLLYKGADFISYKNVSDTIKKSILQYAKNIGEALYKIGYLGICGLDLLICDEKVFFMEINPRFQASSILVNRALNEKCLPDLQTIVYNIYNGCLPKEILKKIENIEINYSTLSFYQNIDPQFNHFILKMLNKPSKYIDKVIIENENSIAADEYMFRVIFNTNISSLNFDGNLFVYQNLLNYSKYPRKLYITDLNTLKCALLTHGVTVDESVTNLYNNKQTIKKATFDAIDIIINNNFAINCPINMKFVEISPFSIRKINQEIGLFYLDNFIHKVEITLQEHLPVKHTKNNINIHRIGFLTTDRLRIKHTSTCEFKRKNKGCKFCHITSKYLDTIPLEDIYETINFYTDFVDFRHFLIGGPSNTYDKEIYYIENIVRYIRSISDKPIYIMSIPPIDINSLERYHQLGVTEVAFNIEIYNRDIAKKLMPGKGAIPLEQYEKALKLSSKLFGIENTRSMLIIGLDSKDSFLEGVEHLCKIGTTPMISPFRPMAHTELSDYVPPTLDYLLDIYYSSKEICKKYNIKLGPTCNFCRNNTLT